MLNFYLLGFPVGAGTGRQDNSSHWSWSPCLPGTERADKCRPGCGAPIRSSPLGRRQNHGGGPCGGQPGDAPGREAGERLGLRLPGEGPVGTQGPWSDASVTTGCCVRDRELRGFRAVPDRATLQPPSVCVVGVPASKQRNPELRAHRSPLQTAVPGPQTLTLKRSRPAMGRRRGPGG